ncbi:MAG: DNA topoisomerase IV subunit A [Candidatus Micrarchaeota archaeon]
MAKKIKRMEFEKHKSTESEKECMKKIEDLAAGLIRSIKKDESPEMYIPIRGLANTNFDAKQQMLQLGDKKSTRKYMNTAHTRKFMQTMLVAEFCYNHLLKEGVHTSIRDMYYGLLRTLPNSKINTLNDQTESNQCAEDVEISLDLIRENLNLIATPKGRVVGNAVIEDIGDTIDWSKMGSGGWAIPSNVDDIKFKEVSADYILVIEKYAAFARLNEDKFWKKQNCVLFTPEGQSSRGLKRIVQRLSTEKKLPVYVCTDGDGYGWYIYSTLKYGSMALAHTSSRLATPKAQFMGLTMDDIKNYDLEKYTIRAETVDLKRAKEIKAYPWFQKKEWQRQLDMALSSQKKAEIESLTSKGIRFLTTDYLPDKIENKDFLP